MLSLTRKKGQLTGDIGDMLCLAIGNTAAVTSWLEPQTRALGWGSGRRQVASQQSVNRQRVMGDHDVLFFFLP